MEDNVLNVAPEKGRKQKRNVQNWSRNKLKVQRHKPKSLPKMPECLHKKNNYKCSSLMMQDVRRFHQAFYSTPVKTVQDNFILKHTQQHKPHRKRPVNGKRKSNEITVTYFVKSKQNGMIKVCAKTFCSILGVSQFRVQNICKKYMASGQAITENRRGDRRSQKYAVKRQSVRTFISNLKCVESHYTREKSLRQYMPSDLSIRKLWRTFCKENEPVNYHFFREIFVRDFNISFRSPATDACSECIRLKALITAPDKNNIKVECITKLRVHKLKSKAFYEMLKQPEENVLKLSFDCQKNMVLPRVPDQIAYYCRQLYQYNFTICQGHSKAQQTKYSVFIYTWSENQRSKGANEIAFMLYHRLCNTSLENVTCIKLFADGCPGMLAKWLSGSNSSVELIQITFPVVGHSYIPPDRVFGRIEKIVKKKDTIIQPEEYKEIFEAYGTVFELEKDFLVYDWKTAVQSTVKSSAQFHFQISACKSILLNKTKTGNVMVKGEVNYKSDLSVYKSILKRGKTFDQKIKPLQLPNEVPVKSLKLIDVDKLLKKHFGEEWRTSEELDLTFYKNVIDNGLIQDHDQEGDSHNNYEEREDLII